MAEEKKDALEEGQPASAEVKPTKKVKDPLGNPYEQYKNYKDPIAKRYRKKMLLNFIVSFSIIAVVIITVIAYLGSIVGNYTIQLQRDQRVLSMAIDPYFVNPKTVLRSEPCESAYPITSEDLPDDSEIDGLYDVGNHNGVAGSAEGGYLAYTFYVKNVGQYKVDYQFTVDINRINVAVDSSTFSIDEVIRVRLFENLVAFNDGGLAEETDQLHSKVTYAKESLSNKIVDNLNNVVDNRECVSRFNSAGVCVGNRDNYRAETFYSEKVVAQKTVTDFAPKSVNRYTVVLWIEGEDPEAIGPVPSGAAIEFSMNFDKVEELGGSTEDTESDDTSSLISLNQNLDSQNGNLFDGFVLEKNKLEKEKFLYEKF